MNIKSYIISRLNKNQNQIIADCEAAYEDYDPLYDPRLDDEGTYDYLANYIPPNSHLWSWEKYTVRCEECGKERKLTVTDTGYFYTYDGYDSMSYTKCWKCELKDFVRSIRREIKKKLQKTTPCKYWKRYLLCKTWDLKPSNIFKEEVWSYLED